MVTAQAETYLSAACLSRLTSSFTKGASGDACSPDGGGGSSGLWGADKMMHWSLLMIMRKRSRLTSRAFSLTKMHVGYELATCVMKGNLQSVIMFVYHSGIRAHA